MGESIKIRPPSVWIIRSGHHDGPDYSCTFKDRQVIAVGYRWFSSVEGQSREDIKLAFQKAGRTEGRDKSRAPGVLFRFASEMRVGDFVLMASSSDDDLEIGVIDGSYRFLDGPLDRGCYYRHARSVNWIGARTRDWFPVQLAGQQALYLPSSDQTRLRVRIGSLRA